MLSHSPLAHILLKLGVWSWYFVLSLEHSVSKEQTLSFYCQAEIQWADCLLVENLEMQKGRNVSDRKMGFCFWLLASKSLTFISNEEFNHLLLAQRFRVMWETFASLCCSQATSCWPLPLSCILEWGDRKGLSRGQAGFMEKAWPPTL